MLQQSPISMPDPTTTPLFAVDGEGAITGDRFARDVVALADCLPRRSHVINLCRDRYRFTVGLIAAMRREQVTLLPSSEAPAAIGDVMRRYPDAYVLYEPDAMAAPDGAAFAYPALPDCDAPPDLLTFPLDQDAVVLFTSGSTGDPVPHPRSWGVLVASSRAAASAFNLGSATGGSILGTVPHQHSYGIESIIMLALQQGMAIHRQRLLLPADIIAELAILPEPRILVTTPIHLRGLVAEQGKLPRVARIICATAPLDPVLAAAAEERFQAPLYEIYGCSEIGQIAARRTVETAEWQCLAGIELTEAGDDVWARGEAAACEATLNDVIDLKAPDRFFLLGRKSDMINIAGKRSSLAFLNHQLTTIPGILDGVFIAPDESGFQGRMRAYVVAPGLSPREVLTALRKAIDPAFLPRPLYFVDALPRNPLGKLTRHAIERLILATVER
jgi:acyl-coenzyme A synthetase/AMP-(fatty) acid ligase